MLRTFFAERIISVQENPVPYTPDQLRAMGYSQQRDSSGRLMWVRPSISSSSDIPCSHLGACVGGS
jgi:hypothetical protein